MIKTGPIAIVERDHAHDVELVSRLAETFEALDADKSCRAVVLCAEGTSFCAGADFSGGAPATGSSEEVHPLYRQALRIFACSKPVVAAVHGAAIGGGLGLALACDFRVTCESARFAANFNRLGVHPGFGLSVTLPRLVGAQAASLLFYTGRRIDGDEAVQIGIADLLVPADQVRGRAISLAKEIAASAPLAVVSTRATLRAGLLELIQQAVTHESREQNKHFQSEDFKEGARAMLERRAPTFIGR